MLADGDKNALAECPEEKRFLPTHMYLEKQMHAKILHNFLNYKVST